MNNTDTSVDFDDSNVTRTSPPDTFTGAVATPLEAAPTGLTYVQICYVSFALVGLCGNSLVLAVIGSHRPLRSRLGNYFIINLTLVDWVISLLLLVHALAQDISTAGKSGE